MNRSVNSPTVMVGSDPAELFFVLPVVVVVVPFAVNWAFCSINCIIVPTVGAMVELRPYSLQYLVQDRLWSTSLRNYSSSFY